MTNIQEAVGRRQRIRSVAMLLTLLTVSGAFLALVTETGTTDAAAVDGDGPHYSILVTDPEDVIAATDYHTTNGTYLYVPFDTELNLTVDYNVSSSSVEYADFPTGSTLSATWETFYPQLCTI